MQRTFVRTALATLAVLALAGTAAAQEPPDTTPRARRPVVHLRPSVGLSWPVTLASDPSPDGYSAWLTRARALGLAAEIHTPVPFLELRAGVVHARPELFASEGRTMSSQGGTSVSLATLDAVVRAPWVFDVRPYLVVGGGIKHYDFNQEQLGARGDEPFARDQTVGLLHFGAGLEWDVGRYSVFLEQNLYISRFDAGSPGLTDRGGQPEWPLTFGLRIPIR
jgi:hypothetical protein